MLPKELLRAALIQVVLVFSTGLFLIPGAHGQDLRCPHLAIAGQDAGPREISELNSLWTSLNGGGTGSPLGCPIGDAAIKGDAAAENIGLVQEFQRGYVYVGMGAHPERTIVVVRGINAWTIWGQGFGLGSRVIARAANSPSVEVGLVHQASWSHLGYSAIISALDGDVTVEICPPTDAPQYCSVLMEPLTGKDRIFDLAASLNPDQLSSPDVDGFSRRLSALLPAWMGCYTLSPAADSKPGEDSVSRAIVMLRGATDCPLSDQSPREQVLNWLSTLRLPADQLPGTGTDNYACGRDGELDVTLVELLHLYLKYRPIIHAASSFGIEDHMNGVLFPWGGPPRDSPYVQPSGNCLSVEVIETENHILLQETARYLINATVGVHRVGLTLSSDNSQNAAWLVRFLRQLIRRDFYEFNALPYSRYQLKALLALNDYAPDQAVRDAARGVIDWILAKEVLSDSLDREHRPYRRRPEPERYASIDWWGASSSGPGVFWALLAGPVQHVHGDIDLQLNDGFDAPTPPTAPRNAFKDVFAYPFLGTMSEGQLAFAADAADTDYRLPDVLRHWADGRYADGSNRTTYLQAYNHRSDTPDDPDLFKQANGGIEVVSGNRNWTMVGGGTPVPPGDPGTPPFSPVVGVAAGTLSGAAVGSAVGAGVGALVGGVPGAAVGALIGALVGGSGASLAGIPGVAAIASQVQDAALWGDQPGVMLETTLISSASSNDRSQTFRFGQPRVTARDGNPSNRLCVAQGFMCGYDLLKPTALFGQPADLDGCPFKHSRTPLLQTIRAQQEGDKTLGYLLGCETDITPLHLAQWDLWTFQSGQIAVGVGDPPGQEHIFEAWIGPGRASDGSPDDRVLHVKWNIRGNEYPWFRVQRTITETEQGGDIPGDDFVLTGDPDSDNQMSDNGEGMFNLNGFHSPTSVLTLVGCKRTTFGHRKCVSGLAPQLRVNVAPAPPQPFSCHTQGVRETLEVYEVGSSCSGSPYGMLMAVRQWSCKAPGVECPDGAQTFGLIIVAPSRGWESAEKFGLDVYDGMERSINQRGPYRPGTSVTVDVPLSPPVLWDGLSWRSTGPESKHTVIFKWPNGSDASVLYDDLSPTFYGPLANDPSTWPTATGVISVPDATTSPLVENSGNGCFTVSGLPTSSRPDPIGLVVDLRDAESPLVGEIRNSQLIVACN